MCPKVTRCLRICAIGTDSVNNLFFSCTLALEIQEIILLWWEIDIPLLFCYESGYLSCRRCAYHLFKGYFWKLSL